MIRNLVGRTALAGFALLAISLTGGLAEANAKPGPAGPGINQPAAWCPRTKPIHGEKVSGLRSRRHPAASADDLARVA